MMTDPDSPKTSLLASFWRNCAGNFGLTTAILLPVAAATAGVALDFNTMVQIRSALQDSADSAVLSAANALAKNDTMSDEAALDLAQKFLKAQFFNVIPDASRNSTDQQSAKDPLAGAVGNVERKTSTSGKTFDVSLNTSYTMPTNGMTALLGWKEVTISVTASARATTESKNALSMFLVLDRSGSMGEDTSTINAAQPLKCGNTRCTFTVPNYVLKIDALKLAVANLTTQLTTADPQSMYVRTAAVSYNASMQTPTSFEWGTARALTYVRALTATGGTDSSGAMSRAYQEVIKTSETTAHKNKNGQDPSRFIVFMTDGDNNNSSADTSTRATCDAAKAAGVQIFTVAFMAPTKGQTLLKNCASSLSNYYDAQNAAELVAAFKQIGEKAVEASTRLTN